MNKKEREAVSKQFKKIGLDINQVLTGDLKEYRHHSFVCKENDQFIIVNAVPQDEDTDYLFWEEWYLNNGEIHHHILTLYKPDKYDAIWTAPAENDNIHPSIAFGRTWYVVEEKDMQAMLERR
jgi:hypothetical protein